MAVAIRSRAQQLYDGTDHVVGQEAARRLMASLLERQWAVSEGRLSQSGGALIGGRSGVGKTLLARSMCRISGLPFAEVNATRYTEAGYAGLDLAQMFLPLLEESARIYDVNRGLAGEVNPAVPTTVMKREPDEMREIIAIAETGVILLDEFDKWMVRINHVTGQKDSAIQADLLKIIEGSREYVTDNQDEVGILFDSTRVLILCAGAFVDLQRQVETRMDVKADDPSIWEHITQDDLTKYGLLPELSGRLATHIFLKPLQTTDLLGILNAPGGIVEEYRTRFEDVGCEWAVSPYGIQYLAEEAIRTRTGARAVEHLAHKRFGAALFEASAWSKPTRARVCYEPSWSLARVE